MTHATLPKCFEQSDGLTAEDLLALATDLRLHELDKSDSPKSDPTSHDRDSIALQTLGLKLLPSLQLGPEKPKVAIHKDRINAILRCLVHIVPLAGTLALLYLNFSKYHLSVNVDSGSLAALQFAAKLHEVTLIASLTTVLLSIMRHDLVSQKGLPFGAAFAPLQITQMTYLWSSELWGAITSKEYGRLFKTRLIVTILFFGVLIAVVGPATAASMIPRRGPWVVASSELAINATLEEIFPVDLQIQNISDDCSQPENCLWKYDLATLVPVLSNISRANIDSDEFATGSWLPTNNSKPFTLSLKTSKRPTRSVTSRIQANNFMGLAEEPIDRSDAKIPEPTMMEIDNCMDSYSTIQCYGPLEWRLSDPLPELSFGDDEGQNLTDWLTLDDKNMIADQIILAQEANIVLNDLRFVNLPGSNKSGIVWIHGQDTRAFAPPPPPTMHSPYSRRAFTRKSDQNVSTLIQSLSIATIVPCSLEIGWVPTRMHIEGQIVTTQSRINDEHFAIQHTIPSKDWLSNVNPFLGDLNSTAFGFLASKFHSSPVYDSMGYILMSTLVTIAQSMMAPPILQYVYIDYRDKSGGWIQNSYSDGFSNSSSKVYSVAGRNLQELKDLAKTFPSHFPRTIQKVGYVYKPDGVAVKLSLAILLIYCAVIITHMVVTIIFGTSSSAWDSLGEVIALAINSRPTPALHNTCAGIMKTSTFEHPVRIAVAPGTGEYGSAYENHQNLKPCNALGRHLELVFTSHEERAVTSVEINAKYGALKLKND